MDNAAKWAAVIARDTRADGTFVYCVKTTNIFCRPNCKARLARRANIEFFDTPAEAQAAGYRACKRCQPLLASYTPEADKIKKACTLLQSLPQNAPLPGLERLAKEAGLTKHHFHRLFKRETGLTPRDYAIATRSKNQSEPTNSGSITPITPFTAITPQMSNIEEPHIADDELLKFGSADQIMTETFKRLSSNEFNTFVVYYTVIETTFGVLLVAFQDRQICKLELGTTEVELLQSLELSFPSLSHLHSPVESAENDGVVAFQQQINAVVEALEQPSGKVLDVPLLLSDQNLENGT